MRSGFTVNVCLSGWQIVSRLQIQERNIVKRIENRLIAPIIFVLLLGTAAPTSFYVTQAQTPGISARVYQDRVRFAAPEGAQEWRLEVFAPDGKKLFNSGFITSSAVDWNIQDPDGQPVEDGTYSYVITTKNENEKSARRRAAMWQFSEVALIAIRLQCSRQIR